MTVLSSGRRSVYVCIHHQNTKLLVDCFCFAVKTQLKRKVVESENNNIEVPKFDITYQDLMAMVMCDTTNLECIVARTVLNTLLWRNSSGTNLQNNTTDTHN